jgi:hypothetical protein
VGFLRKAGDRTRFYVLAFLEIGAREQGRVAMLALVSEAEGNEMNCTETLRVGIASIVSLGVVAAAHAQSGRLAGLPAWRSIATTADGIPGTELNFGSFNQPSVNRNGVVTFRARSVGSSEPMSGVFRRRLNADGQPIEPLFLRGGGVPEPNNSDELSSGSGSGGEPSGFREFPSIPRIDSDSEVIATRGNSTPVWTYLLPDGTETRVGTNGVFVAWNGERVTAFSLLGGVRDAATGEVVFPWFSVPDAPEGTRFDVFPGSPSVTGGRYVVTKANWTDPDTSIGKTGIFVRDLRAPEDMLHRIASSDTVIPGQDPKTPEPVKFGSTSPPSAANGTVVFLGLDSEEAPTMGGLYAAPISGEPTLTEVVMIGDAVPSGGKGDVFTRLGEGVAFNGRFIAFWGAWGAEMREITLQCPTDGNPDIIAYCNELHPAGYTVEIPVHQGVFVHDLDTGETSMVTQTGSAEGDITDFIYWGFSGRAPGAGGHGGSGGGDGGTAEGDDGELARWRSATFIAVESDQWIGGSGNGCRVAFKASAGETVGIYMRDTAAKGEAAVVASTGQPMSAIDPAAGESVLITTLAIERESLRDGWFVIAASGTDEATGESVTGIYASGKRRQVGDIDGDGKSDIAWFHELDRLAALWHVDGGTIEGGYMSTRPNERDSKLVGSGDANGDGRADLLWYDPAAKRYSVWITDDGVEEVYRFDRPVDQEWTAVAFTDVDGDRRADVVFRRTRDGGTDIAVWRLDGGTLVQGVLNTLEGEFEECFVGNFDTDTSAEILLRRLNSGEAGAVYIASFDGASLDAAERIRFSSGELAPIVSPVFVISGVADTDGDGIDDVIWRGPNGSVEHWRMHERGIERYSVIWSATSGYWQITAFPDLDGDGRRGVLFRGRAGETWSWELNGTEILSSSPLREVEPQWSTALLQR